MNVIVIGSGTPARSNVTRTLVPATPSSRPDTSESPRPFTDESFTATIRSPGSTPPCSAGEPGNTAATTVRPGCDSICIPTPA